MPARRIQPQQPQYPESMAACFLIDRMSPFPVDQVCKSRNLKFSHLYKVLFLFFYLYRSLYMQPAATLRDRSLAFAETYGLSSRETQMLEMIVEGSSNKDIAAKLFISENTVKFHIRNLLKKTGCANRSGLISLFNSK